MVGRKPRTGSSYLCHGAGEGRVLIKEVVVGSMEPRSSVVLPRLWVGKHLEISVWESSNRTVANPRPSSCCIWGVGNWTRLSRLESAVFSRYTKLATSEAMWDRCSVASTRLRNTWILWRWSLRWAGFGEGREFSGVEYHRVQVSWSQLPEDQL